MNTALREKELEAMRLKLENLRQQIELSMELQASVEKIQADVNDSQLQGLRIRLEEMLDRKNRLDEQRQTKEPPKNPVSTKKSVFKEKDTTIKKESSPPKTKPAQRGFKLSSVSRKKEKDTESQPKSTIKLGPFTPKQ